MPVEMLESRRLLNGSITAKLTHTGVLQVAGTTDADVLSIEIVNDRIQPSSSAAGYNDDTFLGIPFGTKVKRIRIDLSSGNDKLYIKSSVGTFVDGKSGKDSITIDARRATVHGGSGNDTLQSIPALEDSDRAKRLMRSGPTGPLEADIDEYDVFTGSFNLIEGGPGDDAMFSRGGEDTLAGGSGFDRFVALSDDVSIYHSRTYPFARASVVTVWPSNAMVVEVELFGLREADRPVRAYF